ncbi:MAG: carbohydrate ABC transporter permease [Devosia sp.]|jgi:raffinose/stachyose/melibiose transport system permease protein|nr:sugar ABC transporter permease [Devosiaceae bacterium]
MAVLSETRTTVEVRARRKALSKGALTPYLFLAPALVIYIGFLVYPMLVSLYTSFFEWDGMSATMNFVGLTNYIAIFRDDEVARLAFLNNLFWTLGCLIIPTSIGLILALALNRGLRGTIVFRTIFYAPAVLPLVAVGLIWSWMYNPNFGVINLILKSIGLGRFAGAWLSGFDTAFPSAFATYVWASVGFPMILYLAGLQSISREYYEAARIDGANAWQSFLNVTMPGLRESHVVVLSLAVIGGFKVFDLIYTMTYGGPGRVTQVLGTWMYFQSFQYYHAGYGAALAWLIAVIILVIAVPYIRHMSRD